MARMQSLIQILKDYKRAGIASGIGMLIMAATEYDFRSQPSLVKANEINQAYFKGEITYTQRTAAHQKLLNKLENKPEGFLPPGVHYLTGFSGLLVTLGGIGMGLYGYKKKN